MKTGHLVSSAAACALLVSAALQLACATKRDDEAPRDAREESAAGASEAAAGRGEGEESATRRAAEAARPEVLVVNIGNNLGKSTERIESDESLMKVVDLAREFLKGKGLAQRSYLERPWGLYREGGKWQVWFRQLNEDGTPFEGKPFRYLVLIDEASGEATFGPLK